MERGGSVALQDFCAQMERVSALTSVFTSRTFWTQVRPFGCARGGPRGIQSFGFGPRALCLKPVTTGKSVLATAPTCYVINSGR